MLLFPASHIILFKIKRKPSSAQTILHVVFVENTMDLIGSVRKKVACVNN